jgi:3-dehydroquinate synthase
MREQIEVGLGRRSYTIHVGAGLMREAGALLASFVRASVPVVTDRHVAAIHLAGLVDALDRQGIAARPIVLEPGEGIKSFAGLEQLSGELLASGVERGGLVVALGGGVIGDLTGLAAGLVKRGLAYAQIPTTLLAQVDSSVGGKTAINMREGKNLVGLFHQPRIVIADTDVLATLPRRELLAGYAEVAKYGAAFDAAFFAWLEDNAAEALAGDGAALARMVAHSCSIKAAIVARDEREAGERALLNLGHTFGHALEAATDYSVTLLHGEAIAIGMVLAFRLSAALGHSAVSDTERLEQHLRSVSLPTRIADISGARPSVEALLAHMMHDKKTRDGHLTFVLAHGLGEAFATTEVPLATVRALLNA